QQCSVRAEGQAFHKVFLAFEDFDFVSRSYVPEANIAIAAGRGHGLIVRTYGRGKHLVFMAPEGSQVAAGLSIPNLDDAIVAGTHQEFAVWAEGKGFNLLMVAQLAVTEDARDISGQIGGHRRELPPSLLEILECLLQMGPVF